nr:mechanosensitive ion channel domain-containing protein [uncultured Lachnoclostridium sp.]
MNVTHMGLFLTQNIGDKLGDIELPTKIPTNEKEVKQSFELLDTLGKRLLDGVINLGKTLLIAFLIYFIGKKLIQWILKLTKKFMQKTNMDEGVSKFIVSLLRAILYGILFICVIGKLGIPTSSFIALIGSAGVTIGLALQGSLSNFAGGILILLLKPFRVGDYIIVNGLEGNVVGIDIFYTKLLTGDNRFVVIPNGTLSNSDLINVTNEPVRRLDLLIDVDYSSNIKQVKEVLNRIALNSEYVIQEEYQTDVFVNSFEASSIQMGYRVWVKTEDYFKAKWALLEEIKETFDKENISIPFNQLDVKLVK